ncbi:MAG TPA: hypothetical protein VMU66_03480 [Gaiellales bacterium]|nr:hypothetical protein [Gaiellales bacterium]
MLLHGRGADELDLLPLADAVDPQRRLVGLLPRAPLALPPGGAHWYVVERVGYPHAASFHAGLAMLAGWLDVTLAEHGLDLGRTVVAGFSQGAVMSSAVSLAAGRLSPAGLVMLSGFVPTVDGLELDLHRGPLPVMIAHGSRDRVIPVEFGRAARDMLTSAGMAVGYHESAIPHTIDPAVVAELRGWVADRV